MERIIQKRPPAIIPFRRLYPKSHGYNFLAEAFVGAGISSMALSGGVGYRRNHGSGTWQKINGAIIMGVGKALDPGQSKEIQPRFHSHFFPDFPHSSPISAKDCIDRFISDLSVWPRPDPSIHKRPFLLFAVHQLPGRTRWE